MRTYEYKRKARRKSDYGFLHAAAAVTSVLAAGDAAAAVAPAAALAVFPVFMIYKPPCPNGYLAFCQIVC